MTSTFCQTLPAHVTVLHEGMTLFAVTILRMPLHMMELFHKMCVGAGGMRSFFVVMVMLVIMMVVAAPAALAVIVVVLVIMMVMDASAARAMLMVMLVIMMVMVMMTMLVSLRLFSSPGSFHYFHIRLHGFYHFPNLRKKCIRIFCGKTQLFGRVSDRNIRKAGHFT